MEQTTFGTWLRLKRKALDLTREGLAGRVGFSAATIRKIEAEERRPSAQLVEKLAQIFNIPSNERAAFLRFARGDWHSAPSTQFAGSQDLPWQTSARVPFSNLPATTTTLIGREKEIEIVRDLLLNPDQRLVTLIGPPGIGKTRLSIAAGQTLLPYFPAGVLFVALAPLDNPRMLAPAVAQSLGYVEAKNLSAFEQLLKGIADKRMLLVLDNCEHLIEGIASLITRLLSSCPQLKILATSRESLRIAGELLHPVPALLIPKEDTAISLKNAAEFPGLTLFAERARAVRADFTLDMNNISAVSSICAYLDGLPLAIELIAARIRIMSPQTLSVRMNDQIILTVGDMRTENMRQRTLNNAIGWSYNLLSAEEQALFARLSLFTGGFTLSAAEALFSRTVTRTPIVDLITSLLDKSLLQRTFDEHVEPRFGMLVTIQQFALDCLRRMGDERETWNWHLTYFLDLAYKADLDLKGPRQIEWLHRLYAEKDNLHMALRWAIETGQTETALSMTRHLFWFWFRHSDFNDCRYWLGRVIALPDAPSFPASYAEALSFLGNNNWLQSGPKEARPYVEKALYVARANGDTHNIAQALMYLGLVLTNELDFTAAQITLEESRALFGELGDEWEEKAHVILATALGPYLQKDWIVSLAIHEQALAGFRAFGDIFFQTVCLRFVGKLQVKLGNIPQGKAALEEGLILARQLDCKYEIGAMLLSLGEAAQSVGKFVRAVCLYLAAKNFYSSIGAWMQQDDAEFGNNLITCKEALGEAEFSTAEKRGRAMTTDEAVAFALEQSAL